MLQTIEKGKEEKISIKEFREKLPNLCVEYLRAAIFPEILNWLSHNQGMS